MNLNVSIDCKYCMIIPKNVLCNIANKLFLPVDLQYYHIRGISANPSLLCISNASFKQIFLVNVENMFRCEHSAMHFKTCISHALSQSESVSQSSETNET